MRRNKIYIIIFLSIAIIGLFLYQYVLNIYEVEIHVNPQNLYADNQSTLTINAIPINSFGMKAPFRDSPATFEIREGKDLVEIVTENEQQGFLTLQSKNRTGKVIVFVKPKYALLPSSVEIEILPNLVEI